MPEETEHNIEEEESKKLENYYRIVKPLKTYEREAAELVREKKASQTSIRLEEQQRQSLKSPSKKVRASDRSDKQSVRPKKDTSLAKLALSLIVLILSIISIFAFTKLENRGLPKEITERPTLKVEILIRGDRVENLDLTGKNRDEILTAINQASTGLPKNPSQIAVIYPTENFNGDERALNGEEFLARISSDAPGYLLRAIGPKMTFGYYTESQTKPFLLLEVNSFGNAFAGMLQWEKNMSGDLERLVTNEVFGNKQFDDYIIGDKDARLLRNSSREVVLIYSFLDKKTLLIVSDLQTFRGILDKFSSIRI